MPFTLVVRRGKPQLIGQLQELPGVLTQGRTVAEVQANTRDALALYLDAEKQPGPASC